MKKNLFRIVLFIIGFISVNSWGQLPNCQVTIPPPSIFSATGETRTITLGFSPNSNDCASSICFTGVPEWVTITQINLLQLQITTQENTTNGDRNGLITYAYDSNPNAYLGFFQINQAEGCYENWYLDTDGDGYGNYNDFDPVSSCTAVTGRVNNNLDYCTYDANANNNGCYDGYVYENMNWTISKGYDINGTIKASSKSYFDDLGRGIQSQSLDLKTNKSWATQTMYDAQGRPALQTLSAPINASGSFLYKLDFVKKIDGSIYNEFDFESDPENPTPVGKGINTLGHYFSANNTNSSFEGNSYQDITDYPFTRTIYSKLNPGNILKTLGANKVDVDGNGTLDTWLQGYEFNMQASNELSEVGAFDNAAYNSIETVKTINRDVHGVETAIFNDTDGKILAVARSGGDIVRTANIAIGEQGYVDVHVPQNENAKGFVVSSSDITVYDLITEQVVVSNTSTLPNGFYRIVINDLENYTTESVMVTYKENYYDYNLYEYDDAGRLLASYQALFNLKNEFKYNSLNQLVYSKSPDKGEAWFKYRSDGQIRFSQNSKQAIANEFSYTNYDSYGRPVESGVFTENNTYAFDAENNNALDGIINNSYTQEQYVNDLDDLPNANCKEQQFTLYDEKDSDALSSDMATLFMGDAPEQRFVAGNVSKTYNENTITWYSYDAYGRVEWMVQNIIGLGIKTIDYVYDPITGNVTQVDYQKYVPNERFIHKYIYNIVDELEQVITSSDGGQTFINQVKYYYYENGALRRTELADNLQGIDFVYNLAGQLKAINDPQNNDPGNDGIASNGFNTDVFSMRLDYYNGDYARSSTPTPIGSVNDGKDQFNGNIKAMTWVNKHPNTTPTAQTYYYGYNKNNWLESAGMGAPIEGTGTAQDSIIKNTVITTNEDIVARQSITLLPGFHVQTGTVFTAKIDPNAQGANGGDYNVSNITYDANGNIKTLNRNKQTENSGSNVMDQLTYEYYDDPSDPDNFRPNQLKRVDDLSGTVLGANDIGDQDGDNYKYNSIGQLVENVSEGIKYFYSVGGLVTEVQHNNQPIVKFYYNDKDYRVRKESFINGSLTSTDHYIRDATGNTLAVYKNNILTELPIYGAERIGVHYKETNTYYYQLVDHLGNVRAVIQRMDPNPSTTTDYYPFGMAMPGRQTIGGEQYRYAFQGQEKDQETGKEAFELRLWDARIGRWLTTDPAGQYSSPYLGMGNNPINGTDPDGAFFTDYVNKETGESVYVNDGLNQVLEIDAKYWNWAVGLSKSYDGGNFIDNFQNYVLQKNGTARPDLFFTINNVLEGQKLIKYRGSSAGNDCFACSREQEVKNGGNPAYKNGQINLWTLSDSDLKADVPLALRTIRSNLLKGHSVQTGVYYDYGSTLANKNQLTKHFVNIVGQGHDKHGNYFIYWDNVSTPKFPGTDTAQNRFYLRKDALFDRSTWTKQSFRVTEIRPNINID